MLRPNRKESLSAHHILCHPETIEPRRSPAQDVSCTIVQGK